MGRELHVRFREGLGVKLPRATRLVILHHDLEAIQHCQTVAQEWLKGMGLEMKASKTRIAHTLREQDGTIGFDFLGFNVRQYPVGKYHTGKDTRGRPLGFKSIIKPSKVKVKIHQRRLAEVVKSMRGVDQRRLIDRLNPIIKGWSNYYRTVAAAQIFRKVDDVLYHILRAWAKWRHPHKGERWIVRKYWRLPEWTFATAKGPPLFKHGQMPIRRHVKVMGSKSPYDGDWAYWANRMGYYPGISLWLAMLIKRQDGRCTHCGLQFMPGDLIEVHHQNRDHSDKKRQNLAALHRHCHDVVHRPSDPTSVEGVHDKDESIEEPYECESLMYGFEDQHAGRPAC